MKKSEPKSLLTSLGEKVHRENNPEHELDKKGPSFDFIYGGFKQENPNSNNPNSTNSPDLNAIRIPTCPTTYYANTKICSPRSSRKYPKEVGKLCKNVFDEDDLKIDE